MKTVNNKETINIVLDIVVVLMLFICMGYCLLYDMEYLPISVFVLMMFTVPLFVDINRLKIKNGQREGISKVCRITIYSCYIAVWLVVMWRTYRIPRYFDFWILFLPLFGLIAFMILEICTNKSSVTDVTEIGGIDANAGERAKLSGIDLWRIAEKEREEREEKELNQSTETQIGENAQTETQTK